MSAARRSWKFEEVYTAIRTSFLGCPLDRWSHGAFGVDELEDRVEHEPQDLVDFGDDAEFESEIEAVVGALQPVEDSDAVEVLATRKQTRKAVTQEKLSRGWEHLCANAQTARQSARTFPKPDLAELAGRTRTVGNLTMSAESVQRSAQASERTLACELVPAMFGEGCERGTVETLLVGTSRANEGDHSPCGSQRKRATLAFERAPGGVQVSQRQHSAFAGGSRTGMGFVREDNSLCGTHGS